MNPRQLSVSFETTVRRILSYSPASVLSRQRSPKPRRIPLSSPPVPVCAGKTTLVIRASIMLFGCTLNYIESAKIVNRYSSESSNLRPLFLIISVVLSLAQGHFFHKADTFLRLPESCFFQKIRLIQYVGKMKKLRKENVLCCTTNQ